ncbi:hypothetical protein SeMB42_g02059 [Synchytrium endobioticum]|uniref:Radical S-adenosyl methionine domain-containing protein 1, mitochondrial n=1 Tax=Synchytrium endobioticum TaxID=286115 RepID=A0A507DI97_9FUNG|nr:hypothetical protein SeLEV6574_g01997 [Synchytrium endobioticum]TPX50957.1 hypothetical protein SeMB42_g02059 [Synchytrium endobioticum]
MKPRPLSIYIHYPYCKAKCTFCAFNKYIHSSEVDEQVYVKAYKREFDFNLDRFYGNSKPSIESVYFGGGTPSLMQPSTVEAILSHVAARCDLDTTNAEVTLEVNPTSVEAPKLYSFKCAGVNRVSLGVQALNPDDLRVLGRDHDVRDARAAIDLAQRTFGRVSLDFIWGRPAQSPDQWRRELRDITGLGAQHLSIYQLIVERGTAMHKYHQKQPHLFPSEDAQATMYNDTIEIAGVHGYEQYEVSSFAKAAAARSRHNMGYWTGRNFIGLGPGAHGRVSAVGESARYGTACIRAPKQWVDQCLSEAGHGMAKITKMSEVETRREIMAQGLRLVQGVSVQALQHVVPHMSIEDVVDLDMMDTLVQRGLLVAARDENNGTVISLRTTPKGLVVLDGILGRLLK